MLGRVGAARAAAGVAVAVLALAGAAVAAVEERRSFVEAFARIGVWPVVAAAGCGLVGVGASYPVWRQVLSGLGVHLERGPGARIFFVSQLGKYIPGSVWPVVMQVEAGRSRGASRRTMLAANLIMLMISCTAGLVLAAAILPVYDRQAFDTYWWGLLAVPVLLGLLHPRALTGLLDRVAALLHRPPLGGRLAPAAEARAFGLAVVSWLGYGLELAVLASAATRWSLATVALCVGAMALAVPLGILFVPAPAGLGIRDVVLALALSSVMPGGRALAVVVASRAVIVACDLAAAAAVAAWPRSGSRPRLGRRGGRAGERTRTSTPLGTRT